jgi:hypothetical protein
MKRTTYEASDYAGMTAGPYSFYYGYEYARDDDGDVWGFECKKDGKMVCHFPHEPSGYGCARDLLECIGIMIEKKCVGQPIS